MPFKELNQQIRNLLLPWWGRWESITGGMDLRPIQKWLALVLGIFLEIVVLLNLLASLGSQIRLIGQSSQELTNLQAKVNQIQGGYQLLQKKPILTEGLLSSLQPASTNSQLVEKLALFAANNQLVLESISLDPPAAASQAGLFQRKIEINLRGDYQNLSPFINAVDQEIPSLIIRQVSISLSNNNLPGGQIRMKLSLSSFSSAN